MRRVLFLAAAAAIATSAAAAPRKPAAPPLSLVDGAQTVRDRALIDPTASADDTLDKVDPADLAQNVAVWASFIFTVANSDIDFRALRDAAAK